MLVEVKFIENGCSENVIADIAEEQAKKIQEIIDEDCSAIDELRQKTVEELRQKTIAALAKQVDLLDQCDNALTAQITEMKFRVLNKTLRTLDSI